MDKRESFAIPMENGEKKKEEEITLEDIMQCWPMNRPNFERLVDIAGKNKLVPLIGSGVTRNLTKGKQNFLAWNELFSKIAGDNGFGTDIIQELTCNNKDNFDFENAGEIIENLLCRPILQEVLREQYNPNKLSHDKIKRSVLSYLPALNPEVILTTNYDTAIERAFYLNRFPDNALPDDKEAYLEDIRKGERDSITVITPSTSTREFINLFRNRDSQINKKTILYKFHGDVQDEGKTHDLILSKSSYDNAYGTINEIENRTSNKDIVRNLYTFLFARHILFIGCGLENDRIMKLIRANAEGEHFALVSCENDNQAKERCSKLKALNIRPIFYPQKARSCIKTIIEGLINMNTAWDIASVCRPKDQWLKEYLNKVNKGKEHIEKHMVFFGGIFGELRRKNSDYLDKMDEWLGIHTYSTIYFCYDSLDMIKRRNEQLDSNTQTLQQKDPAKKIEEIERIPSLYSNYNNRKGIEGNIRLIPIKYDLNGYAVIMDDHLFWSFKTHERSSQSPIIELDLKRPGSEKFVKYMIYALTQSKVTDSTLEGKATNDIIDSLVTIIEHLGKA